MAKVTFRRGSASLYKERWQDYIKNGNQSYAYLQNAIYFATDTRQLYLDGQNFTFEDDIDLSNVIESIDYDKTNNSLKIDYADSEKGTQIVYLSKVAIKPNSILSLDTSTGANGELIYEIGIDDISDVAVGNLTTDVDETNIQNGDSISYAFSKVNDSLTWVEADELDLDETPYEPIKLTKLEILGVPDRVEINQSNIQLRAKLTPSNAENVSLEWVSGDEGIATISQSGILNIVYNGFYDNDLNVDITVRDKNSDVVAIVNIPIFDKAPELDNSEIIGDVSISSETENILESPVIEIPDDKLEQGEEYVLVYEDEYGNPIENWAEIGTVISDPTAQKLDKSEIIGDVSISTETENILESPVIEVPDSKLEEGEEYVLVYEDEYGNPIENWAEIGTIEK